MTIKYFKNSLLFLIFFRITFVSWFKQKILFIGCECELPSSVHAPTYKSWGLSCIVSIESVQPTNQPIIATVSLTGIMCRLWLPQKIKLSDFILLPSKLQSFLFSNSQILRSIVLKPKLKTWIF